MMNFKTIALFTFLIFQSNGIFCAQAARPVATAEQVAALLKTVEDSITEAYIEDHKFMSENKEALKTALAISTQHLPLFPPQEQVRIKKLIKAPLIIRTRSNLSQIINQEVPLLLERMTGNNKWPDHLINQITDKILNRLMTVIDSE